MRDGFRLLSAAIIAALLAPPTPARADTRFDARMEVTPEEGPLNPVVEKRYSPQFRACQDRASITQDNARCFENEFVRQDVALNRAWKATLNRMPSVDRGPLLAAQRKWIAARDPFCRKDSDGFQEGTIAPVIYVSCRVELTIRRTIWLEQLR